MPARVPQDKPHEIDIRQLRAERHSEDQRLTALKIRLRDELALNQVLRRTEQRSACRPSPSPTGVVRD